MGRERKRVVRKIDRSTEKMYLFATDNPGNREFVQQSSDN